MYPTLHDLRDLAAQLRVDSIRCTTAAGSGHPTSSLSAADLMAVLLAKYLRFNWKNPKNTTNDRLIFSKGHACPLLYSMHKAAGVISEQELLSLRKINSPLQGHPNPRVYPYVEVATGSLGMGLAIGMGMALVAKNLDHLPLRVWVVLGDSEMAEGSIWEGFDKAAYYKLNNVIAILDMNRLGQRGPTELQWDGGAYAARARSFGWHALEIDGHDLSAIVHAYEHACQQADRPTIVIAKTLKGAGVKEIADKENWHGKALPADMAQRAIAELGGVKNRIFQTPIPPTANPPVIQAGPPTEGPAAQTVNLPKYKLGSKEATRKAYGDALAALGSSNANLVALDGEVSNSTYSDIFGKAFPQRFFEMFISEQCMVSVANGMAVLGKRVFASTFAAFLTRAYDQVRLAAIAGATFSLSGSHAGVSIGEDGPSQMALEDLAMFRAVCESTVLYPCDPNQTAKLVEQMMTLPGLSYLRTTREKTPVIYSETESFSVGGSKTIKSSTQDKVAVVAAGITVHESLKAYEQLQKEGVSIRVIDAYSVKPIDENALRLAAKECEKMVTVEDHWPEGGLGDAVLDAFTGKDAPKPTVLKLAPRQMPGSATPAELLRAAGIDADAIIAAVKSLI
jgi:transketolase